MDLATVIGITGGIILLLIGCSGGSISALRGFFDMSSIYITVGGSLAAMLINFPLERFSKAFKSLRWVFFTKSYSGDEIINTLVRYAEKARREGLLALEDEIESSSDEFLKKGIQLVVDGTDPELVKNILEIEIGFLEERHNENKAFWESWGGLAPSFGLTGTVIGLIKMLGSLDDPSSIGPAMAVALLTTLYGAVMAYLIFNPIAAKLGIRTDEEIMIRQIMVEGILSVQAGENPRIVEEKLKSFLPPAERHKVRRERAEGVAVHV
ncbi:MAG: motility protein A [Firmicutes bacterium]|nr:motility protein A [Bacillota bacterium]